MSDHARLRTFTDGQETIIPRIHTEYTTIITREIHRHHV